MKTGDIKFSKKMFKAIFIGTLSGVILCTILLMTSAFLFTKSGSVPHTIVEPLVLILAGVGAFAGGYISGRISNEKGMLYGIICGFIMFIIFFICGLIAVKESITMVTLIRGLLMLLTSAIGGIVGVNKR